MTDDATALSHHQRYHGPNSVELGNGDTLNIASTGTIPFDLNSSSFILRNVFFVSSLGKNLLSVARLTYDNNVAICFFPFFYRIYNLRTGALLFHGPCENGLYLLSVSLPKALDASFVDWYQRLGHRSLSVLSRLGSSLGPHFTLSHFFL